MITSKTAVETICNSAETCMTKETLDKRGLIGSSKEASVPLPVEYF